jgi:hypothetical protein
MVETAGDVESDIDLALGNQFSTLKRCPCVKLRPLPKTRKDGVVPRAHTVRKSSGHAT